MSAHHGVSRRNPLQQEEMYKITAMVCTNTINNGNDATVNTASAATELVSRTDLTKTTSNAGSGHGQRR